MSANTLAYGVYPLNLANSSTAIVKEDNKCLLDILSEISSGNNRSDQFLIFAVELYRVVPHLREFADRKWHSNLCVDAIKGKKCALCSFFEIINVDVGTDDATVKALVKRNFAILKERFAKDAKLSIKEFFARLLSQFYRIEIGNYGTIVGRCKVDSIKRDNLNASLDQTSSVYQYFDCRNLVTCYEQIEPKIKGEFVIQDIPTDDIPIDVSGTCTCWDLESAFIPNIQMICGRDNVALPHVLVIEPDRLVSTVRPIPPLEFLIEDGMKYRLKVIVVEENSFKRSKQEERQIGLISQDNDNLWRSMPAQFGTPVSFEEACRLNGIKSISTEKTYSLLVYSLEDVTTIESEDETPQNTTVNSEDETLENTTVNSEDETPQNTTVNSDDETLENTTVNSDGETPQNTTIESDGETPKTHILNFPILMRKINEASSGEIVKRNPKRSLRNRKRRSELSKTSIPIQQQQETSKESASRQEKETTEHVNTNTGNVEKTVRHNDERNENENENDMTEDVTDSNVVENEEEHREEEQHEQKHEEQYEQQSSGEEDMELERNTDVESFSSKKTVTARGEEQHKQQHQQVDNNTLNNTDSVSSPVISPIANSNYAPISSLSTSETPTRRFQDLHQDSTGPFFMDSPIGHSQRNQSELDMSPKFVEEDPDGLGIEECKKEVDETSETSVSFQQQQEAEKEDKEIEAETKETEDFDLDRLLDDDADVWLESFAPSQSESTEEFSPEEMEVFQNVLCHGGDIEDLEEIMRRRNGIHKNNNNVEKVVEEKESGNNNGDNNCNDNVQEMKSGDHNNNGDDDGEQVVEENESGNTTENVVVPVPSNVDAKQQQQQSNNLHSTISQNEQSIEDTQLEPESEPSTKQQQFETTDEIVLATDNKSEAYQQKQQSLQPQETSTEILAITSDAQQLKVSDKIQEQQDAIPVGSSKDQQLNELNEILSASKQEEGQHQNQQQHSDDIPTDFSMDCDEQQLIMSDETFSTLRNQQEQQKQQKQQREGDGIGIHTNSTMQEEQDQQLNESDDILSTSQQSKKHQPEQEQEPELQNQQLDEEQHETDAIVAISSMDCDDISLKTSESQPPKELLGALEASNVILSNSSTSEIQQQVVASDEIVSNNSVKPQQPIQPEQQQQLADDISLEEELLGALEASNVILSNSSTINKSKEQLVASDDALDLEQSEQQQQHESNDITSETSENQPVEASPVILSNSPTIIIEQVVDLETENHQEQQQQQEEEEEQQTLNDIVVNSSTMVHQEQSDIANEIGSTDLETEIEQKQEHKTPEQQLETAEILMNKTETVESKLADHQQQEQEEQQQQEEEQQQQQQQSYDSDDSGYSYESFGSLPSIVMMGKSDSDDDDDDDDDDADSRSEMEQDISNSSPIENESEELIESFPKSDEKEEIKQPTQLNNNVEMIPLKADLQQTPRKRSRVPETDDIHAQLQFASPPKRKKKPRKSRHDDHISRPEGKPLVANAVYSYSDDTSDVEREIPKPPPISVADFSTDSASDFEDDLEDYIPSDDDSDFKGHVKQKTVNKIQEKRKKSPKFHHFSEDESSDDEEEESYVPSTLEKILQTKSGLLIGRRIKAWTGQGTSSTGTIQGFNATTERYLILRDDDRFAKILLLRCYFSFIDDGYQYTDNDIPQSRNADIPNFHYRPSRHCLDQIRWREDNRETQEYIRRTGDLTLKNKSSYQGYFDGVEVTKEEEEELRVSNMIDLPMKQAQDKKIEEKKEEGEHISEDDDEEKEYDSEYEYEYDDEEEEEDMDIDDNTNNNTTNTTSSNNNNNNNNNDITNSNNLNNNTNKNPPATAIEDTSDVDDTDNVDEHDDDDDSNNNNNNNNNNNDNNSGNSKRDNNDSNNNNNNTDNNDSSSTNNSNNSNNDNDGHIDDNNDGSDDMDVDANNNNEDTNAVNENDTSHASIDDDIDNNNNNNNKTEIPISGSEMKTNSDKEVDQTDAIDKPLKIVERGVEDFIEFTKDWPRTALGHLIIGSYSRPGNRSTTTTTTTTSSSDNGNEEEEDSTPRDSKYPKGFQTKLPPGRKLPPLFQFPPGFFTRARNRMDEAG